MWHKEVIKLGKFIISFYFSKHKFHPSKLLIDINDVDIQHIIVSKKCSIRKKCLKYFIAYAKHSFDDIKPLSIKLLKLNESIEKIFKK